MQLVQLIALSWPLQQWGLISSASCLPRRAITPSQWWQLNTSKKWVEAKPLTNVSSASIRTFFWQNIICHYGIPRHTTVDIAKYFDNALFKDLCKQIGMKVAFASVYHPQSNGAVERANSLIFDAIKKILDKKKGKWAEVMPTVIWSHNTIVCRAINFTPFYLMYGAEAILLEEIKH
jgi:hypothetical protein